jgi:ecotin
MAGTLIAVDPNAPKAPRFISLGGEPMLVRYNSRLPLVVYVPECVEVKYRLWSASPETKSLERG